MRDGSRACHGQIEGAAPPADGMQVQRLAVHGRLLRALGAGGKGVQARQVHGQGERVVRWKGRAAGLQLQLLIAHSPNNAARSRRTPNQSP